MFWQYYNQAKAQLMFYQQHAYVLTLSCPDKHGIVAALFGFLHAQHSFILESAQFGDPTTEQFFMRVVFTLDAPEITFSVLSQQFTETIAKQFNMRWTIRACQQKMRVMLLVSQYGHCLNALLHRYATNELAIDIAAIVSNHDTFSEMASWYKIPFFHLPISPQTRTQQENKLMHLCNSLAVDLVVLARYMQILSPTLVTQLQGKAINIHHSFLPSFKGAKPYHQAYARGVKLIGATAHYVTNTLDEGPIIEQEVIRVNHADSPEHLAALGRDIESVVLTRAIQYHIEQRVLLNGDKTVVFK